MKNLAFLLLLQTLCATAFSQSPLFPSNSTPSPYTNLVMHWKAARHPWPKTIWTYQMVPTKFPPTLVSNLMSLGNLTEKDRWGSVDNTNGIAYFDYKNSLSVSFATGEIDYGKESKNYSVTNLAKDVPEMSQLYGLITNFLPKLGLDYSEIPKTKNGRIQMHFYEPLSGFPASGPNGGFLTNIEMRCASFGRLIDGVECSPIVGNCTFYFGEHSQIMGIHLFWRNVKRDKLYAAATPKQIVQWIHEGKAILPREIYIGNGSTAPINWSTVKKLTIKNATAYYWGEFFLGEREHRPIFPSPVIPYALLQATMDTGATNIDIRIMCPIIDETKPLKTNP